MSSEFSVRWKGALYGINYENWRDNALAKTGRSLVDACCHVIVKDAAFTRTTVPLLPYELLYALMKAAVEQGRHCTVKVLLEVWPARSLCVSVLTPHYHRSGQILYDQLLYSIQLEDAIRLTSSLIHTFIQLAQQAPNHHPGKLKVLDLSGFPVVEPVLQLVSHTIAERHFHYECPAQRHSQEPCLTTQSYARYCKSEETDERGEPKTNKRQRHNIRNKGCYCDPYIIRMDCFIRDEIILDELCRALRASRAFTPHLKLQVSKVDAICLGERPLLGLLKLLDTDLLTGIGMEYNGFCNEGVIHLEPEMSKFLNMTALDLSCNNINMPQNAQVCLALGKTLEALKKLTRLDLSNNRLSGCLASLLSRVSHHYRRAGRAQGQQAPFVRGPPDQPEDEEEEDSGPENLCTAPCKRQRLEYLKLSACQLKEEDVEYLATCHHVSGVIELDLSENFFASRIKGLLRLLETLKNSLQVLELEDCGFKGAQLPLLINAIGKLTELRYLNMARNHLSTQDLCQWLPSLRSLPHLECIRLSSTCDWLDLHSGDGPYPSERGKRRRVEKAVQERLPQAANLTVHREGSHSVPGDGSTSKGCTSRSYLGHKRVRTPVLVVWEDQCIDE